MVRRASEASNPEDGSASVLAVSSVGLLALTVVLGLGARVVAERRAVEDNIAEMRAYWAAMGHATYGLSRVNSDGANNGAGQKPQDVATQAAKEIADGNGGKGTNMNATWRYPDVSAGYLITVAPSPPGPDAPVGPSGVKLTFDFKTCSGPKTINANAPVALRTIVGLRGLVFEYCVVSSTSVACASAPALPPPPTNTNDTNWYAQRIASVQRAKISNAPC